MECRSAGNGGDGGVGGRTDCNRLPDGSRGIRREIERLADATGDSVTVLPILVSRGTINLATIPRDLTGLPIRYVPASLTPSAHLARWIERVALARVRASH
jgi:hypothetical protein